MSVELGFLEVVDGSGIRESWEEDSGEFKRGARRRVLRSLRGG